MPRFKHVFSLILAASTLVVSAYSEAATIRYDVTNALSVQNGYSLSGYFEVSGTGNVTSFLSFSLTATKPDNPTFTLDSGSGAIAYTVDGVTATDSALYLADYIGNLNVFTSDYSGYMQWRHEGAAGFDLYIAQQGDTFWQSDSFPVTDGNNWQIGSVQAVPEIDPNSLGSVLALLLGSLGLLERRRLKAA